MNSNGHLRAAKEIFLEAIKKPTPRERAEYLDAVCRGDSVLRQCVVELLAQHFDPATPLKEPAPERWTPVMPAAPPVEGYSTRIGRYKLLQAIGEGGMGVVYLAEQKEPIRRRVALKIVKLGMDTRQFVARFEAERQALALMDHPNIARVLDGGMTDAGRPYFVMELVQGLPITEFCDKHRLPILERLKLFIPVCQAIQSAHQKGIIHRDLKPSNILVTLTAGTPVPKVIDFGVAKAINQRLTEKTLFTNYGTLLGTPAYMSPEQAEMTSLDVDTRTDIYSLGAVLYELLTGTTPFAEKQLRGAGYRQMQRIIQEEQPARPSTRLKTMVPEHYGSLARNRGSGEAALARSFRGDLDWIVMKCLEKDRARRYETVNGLARDIQRHLENEPVVACPPSRIYRFQKLVRRNRAVFASTAGFALAIAIGFVAVTWQWHRAKVNWFQAQANAAAAANEASKSQYIAQLLKEMLQTVGPSVDLNKNIWLRRTLLEQTAQLLDKDPTIQPEVAADFRISIGQIYFDLGLYNQAEGMLRAAAELARGPGKSPCLTARALSELGRVLWHEAKFAEAEATERDALTLWRRLGDFPEMAFCLHELGSILQMRGQLGDAEPCFREALDIRRRVFGETHMSVAESLNGMAVLLTAQGRWSEAEKYHQETLAIYRKLPGDQSLQVTATQVALAQLLLAEEKVAEAEPLARQALDTRKRVLGDEHPLVAESLSLMAGVFSDENKLSEAEGVSREALAIYKRKGDQDPGVATSLKMLIDILLTQRKFVQAEELFHDFSATRSAGILAVRGHLRARLGRWNEAAMDFNRAIESEPANHENYHALAPLLIQCNDLEGYRALCARIRTRFSGATNDSDIAERMTRACLLLPSVGNDLSIESRWADSAVKRDQSDGGNPVCKLCKGWAEYRQGRPASAVPWLQQALAKPGDLPDCDVASLMVLAMAKYQLNQVDEARAAFARGREIADKDLAKPENGALDHRWIDWVIAQTLMREAGTLLRAQTDAGRNEELEARR